MFKGSSVHATSLFTTFWFHKTIILLAVEVSKNNLKTFVFHIWQESKHFLNRRTPNAAPRARQRYNPAFHTVPSRHSRVNRLTATTLAHTSRNRSKTNTSHVRGKVNQVQRSTEPWNTRMILPSAFVPVNPWLFWLQRAWDPPYHSFLLSTLSSLVGGREALVEGLKGHFTSISIHTYIMCHWVLRELLLTRHCLTCFTFTKCNFDMNLSNSLAASHEENQYKNYP